MFEYFLHVSLWETFNFQNIKTAYLNDILKYSIMSRDFFPLRYSSKMFQLLPSCFFYSISNSSSDKSSLSMKNNPRIVSKYRRSIEFISKSFLNCEFLHPEILIVSLILWCENSQIKIVISKTSEHLSLNLWTQFSETFLNIKLGVTSI